MFVTEMHLKVYNETEGNFITIRPSPDFPNDAVMLIAEGKENIEYFGNISLDLPKEMMKQIGQALIAVADSLEGV